LVGLVGLVDGARAADHGGYAHVLEQAGLGTEADHGSVVAGQFARDADGFGLGHRLQAAHLADDVGDEIGIGTYPAHARQQFLAGVAVDSLKRVARVVAIDRAHLPVDLAMPGDDVARNAAGDATGLDGAPRRVERTAGWSTRLEFLGNLHQAGDEPHRVLDSVDAAVGHRAVSFQAGEHRMVLVAALVPLDDSHAGRLADDADRRSDAAARELFQHQRRTETTDFLVEAEGEVHRAHEIGLAELRRHGQGAGDERLHVAGAAAVDIAVADAGPERVDGPRLALDRHHVGVAGQDEAAVGFGAERGEQVGLVAVCVVSQFGAGAEALEDLAGIADQV